MPIKLSVALVTRNRPAELYRCLASWAGQHIVPHEIIVSDDSDPEMAAKNEAVVKRFRAARLVSGPRKGLHANRNNAALACNGTHILSADDDHTHPVEFLEAIIDLIARDASRVWTFPEKLPDEPDLPPGLPTELDRSGFGRAPVDPSNCAAIADGASIYPRGIFEQGLRYDETYPFGAGHYIWGKLLEAWNWQISISEETFIWHHVAREGMKPSKRSFQQQLASACYASFLNALIFERSRSNLAWAFYYLFRRTFCRDSIVGHGIPVRIPPANALKVMRNAFSAEKRHDFYRLSKPSRSK